ncbi:phosphoribosylanthranilate isomerase [Evtepia sp.]|uniref:phosphoribosylanthranilate isomerase n=1 Tax=Evtepia sp. TaxID=2773933 RepID=UPI002A7F553A|nr:phosphoribosylanthranilate isomerase [Evtepia sp.]MDY4429358.1 phosphoribosylanthranilate isomerase [Evtepia sp.]
MTKIKLCGLKRPQDIQAANELLPAYIGFVFAPKSRRYVHPARAEELRRMLNPGIIPVGVFVNETPETVAALLDRGIIDIAQLHGKEDAAYIRRLRQLTKKPLIQAFRIDTPADVAAAQASTADYVLLDSGAGGTGTCFDWSLLKDIQRPYFLAGGLTPENVGGAVATLHPYAVDVSSGIETDGAKDKEKMTRFVRAVRGVPGKDEEP